MRLWFLAPILVLAATSVSVADDPKPAAPVTSATAVMISSNDVLMPPASGCSSCDARANSKLAAKLKPRPEPYCLGCSTLRCEWRFFFGSCRAFYGEGRFKPALPAITD